MKACLVRGCVLAYAATLAAFAAIGCGGPCEDAAEKICAKACECGDCAIGVPPQSQDVVGNLTISFSDEGDCEAASDCGDTKTSDETFEACSADIDDASCEEGAVILPDSCI